MRPRARAPTCPLATLLSFFPVSRFAPPSPTIRTSLLLSDDVCRRCNLACDRLFTLVKFLHAPFWRPCTLAPGYICTPLPLYATLLPRGQTCEVLGLDRVVLGPSLVSLGLYAVLGSRALHFRQFNFTTCFH